MRGRAGPDWSLAQLKLEAPRQHGSVIERPRLITTLNALQGSRLLLLIAPPGFGKTTLLSQWRAAEAPRTRVAWLTLDEGDAEPRVFLSGLIFALAAARIDVAKLSSHAELGLAEIPLDVAIGAIAAALAEPAEPVAILLDDYHRPSSPVLDELIVKLVRVLPENATIVLSSRVRPNIDAPRLLASGLAAEINAEPLRFTAEESRRVLDADISDAELRALTSETEGWPVAMQLARLVMRVEQSVPASLRRLTVRGGHLSTYLADELIKTLSADCVDFLMETSILERFTTELTDAIRLREDSWTIMEALEPLQSLISPLDAEGRWFRYHHLFADYLQNQLRLRKPGKVAELHLRASEAFAAQGLLVEAVRHAGQAGDFQRCADLIEEAGGWRLVLYGGQGELSQVLACVPQSERLPRPRLLFADTYRSVKAGAIQAARATFDLAGHADFSTDRRWGELSDIDRDALNVGLLLQLYEDRDVDEALVAFLKDFRAKVPASEGLTRGILNCAGAVGALGIGQLTEAEAFAREGMAAMRAASSVLGVNYCFLHAGLASLYRGDMRTAQAYLSQAREMAEENFGADSGLKSISDLIHWAICFWRQGAVPESGIDSAFRHVCDYDGWFDIYSVGLDTRFRLALVAGDRARMAAIVEDGEAVVRERGLERLGWIVRSQKLHCRLAAGDKAGARELSETLAERFRIGGWRSHPALWRPYQDCGHAMIYWCEGADRQAGLALADDLLANARAVGAGLYEIRALLLRARLHDRMGQGDEVIADLALAVGLAAAEGVRQPFFEQPQLAPHLRRLKKDLWHGGGDPVEAAFLASLTADLAGAEQKADGALSIELSPRELEVMQELASGATNKEIARTLDMTEHTVKFHLKNIFAKLGVDRRAHALAAFNAGAFGRP